MEIVFVLDIVCSFGHDIARVRYFASHHAVVIQGLPPGPFDDIDIIPFIDEIRPGKKYLPRHTQGHDCSPGVRKSSPLETDVQEREAEPLVSRVLIYDVDGFRKNRVEPSPCRGFVRDEFGDQERESLVSGDLQLEWFGVFLSLVACEVLFPNLLAYLQGQDTIL